MLLALDRKSFIDMLIQFQIIEQPAPNFFALSSIHKGLGVPYHDQTIAGSRKQDINTFWCGHEADVM
jgi:hypothetical protein